MNNFEKKLIAILSLVILLFCSCSPVLKLFFNIKNPRVYSSYFEVEPKLVSQINKTGITEYAILYSDNAAEDYNTLYFNGNGTPLPKSSCGTIMISESVVEIPDLEMLYSDTLLFDHIVHNWVTMDSLPFTKDLSNYNYIAITPKTTFMIGVEKRKIKDISISFPDSCSVFYIFVNTDCYVWQNNEYKAGQKLKIKKEPKKEKIF